MSEPAAVQQQTPPKSQDEPRHVLALTMGDPAGIGLEITLKAWSQRKHRRLPPFVIYADANALTARAKALNLDVPISRVTSPAVARALFTDALPVIDIKTPNPVTPGKPDKANANAVIASIDHAVADVADGHTSAIVTNPISKETLYNIGFEHPGHTEYLAHLAARFTSASSFHPVMMLSSDMLKVVPLTIHMPLRDVPSAITKDLIIQTATITANALHTDFGIKAPRLAITGLNPHAGENGALGTEENECITPAIRQLRTNGLEVTGPHPADTLFHEAARKTYDAVIAMYHDQALIPIKALAFDTGVNVTLGLPFVRTSPDHGTAFNIAAKGTASPESLINSLQLAASIAQRRRAHAQA